MNNNYTNNEDAWLNPDEPDSKYYLINGEYIPDGWDKEKCLKAIENGSAPFPFQKIIL